jgi:hypothetical protein
MINRKLLVAAQARNILTARQAEELTMLAREMAQDEGVPLDRERVRLVTGFSDIFVAIGLFMLFSSMLYLTALVVPPLIVFLIVSAAAWLLAETFTLRQRQALPSIILVSIFALSVLIAANQLIGMASGDDTRTILRTLFDAVTVLHRLLLGHNEVVSPVDIAAVAIATLAIAMHYARFQVPVSIAMGGLYFAALVLGSLDWAFPGFVQSYARWFMLATGLALFTLAMRFDLSDPERETRRADIAFWLHIYAAPLIVHPLVNPFLKGAGFPLFGNPVSIIFLVVMLTGVALAIDRRAILVASLVYLGFAIGSLSFTFGLVMLPIVLFILGSFVLLMSAFWVPMRNALLQQLPESLVRRLPRPGA